MRVAGVGQHMERKAAARRQREEQGQPSVTYVYMGVRYDLVDARMRIAADKQSKWLDDIAPKWDGVKPGSLVDDKKLSGTVGFTVFLLE